LSAKVAGEANIAKSMAPSHAGLKTVIILPQVVECMGVSPKHRDTPTQSKLSKRKRTAVNLL
jgi:hypothetical protein